MPRLLGVHTAVPPYRTNQAEAASFARKHFGPQVHDFERLLPVFENTGIDTRYFSAPLEWIGDGHSPAEKNELYIRSATDLSVQATKELLELHDLRPSDIDYIIYVNTTGLATPSIDARIINRLGFRSNIRRTPIWGLGCAGGAAGLAHAYHHALGHPNERVLVVACELCGLTFMPDDYSKSNVVAAALFGEGAAAALVGGDGVGAEGVDILGSNSRFYPDSLDVMGWNVVTKGLQVVFAQRIPDIVAANAREDFEAFLDKHDLTLADIAAYIFHPGGTKVINAYRTALGLQNGELSVALDILREYGNMSSVSVLFVLERFLASVQPAVGEYGLLSALGPGFCSESLLLKF